MEEERRAREELCRTLPVQDKIDRAAGVLQSARLLSSQEFMELISYLRMGLAAGLLQGAAPQDLNALTMEVQPRHADGQGWRNPRPTPAGFPAGQARQEPAPISQLQRSEMRYVSFSRITEKANTALNLAITCAGELGHDYIGSTLR